MILIVLNQSWVVTQFGWTEQMVLVNKNQTWNRAWFLEPEPGSKLDRNQTWPSSGTEIRTFENKFFWEKKVWNQGLTSC